MEIEIKLGPLTAAQAEALFDDRNRLPPDGPTRSIRMQTTYYDTTEGQFARARQTLRLRQEDERRVCTFKTALSGFSRLELEREADTIEKGAAELALDPQMPEEARAALRTGTLVPVCGARFTRRTRPCRVGTLTLELCLDEGELFRGRRTVPLREAELELTQGDPAALEQLALELTAAYDAPECHLSKQQRALSLKEEA